jgi:hypothetical protein
MSVRPFDHYISLCECNFAYRSALSHFTVGLGQHHLKVVQTGQNSKSTRISIVRIGQGLKPTQLLIVRTGLKTFLVPTFPYWVGSRMKVRSGPHECQPCQSLVNARLLFYALKASRCTLPPKLPYYSLSPSNFPF